MINEPESVNVIPVQTARKTIEGSILQIKDGLDCEIATDLHTVRLKDGRLSGQRGFCMHTPFCRKIGIDTSWLDTTDEVPLNAMTDTLTAVYHEAKHMQRYKELESGCGSELIQWLTLADNINPVYYLYNYSNNIRELEADIYGLEQAYNRISECFGEGVADNAIVSHVCDKRYSINDTYRGIDFSKCVTAMAAIQCLDTKKGSILRGELSGTDYSMSKCDPAFEYLSCNSEAARAFLSIPSGNFAEVTEFIATVSVHINAEIKDEFADNALIQCMNLSNLIHEINSRYDGGTDTLKFAAEYPEWFKKVLSNANKFADKQKGSN